MDKEFKVKRIANMPVIEHVLVTANSMEEAINNAKNNINTVVITSDVFDVSTDKPNIEVISVEQRSNDTNLRPLEIGDKILGFRFNSALGCFENNDEDPIHTEINYDKYKLPNIPNEIKCKKYSLYFAEKMDRLVGQVGTVLSFPFLSGGKGSKEYVSIDFNGTEWTYPSELAIYYRV